MDVASSAEKRHCKICARLFPTVTEYAKHLKENHIPKINPTWKCDMPKCEERRVNKAALEYHLQMDHRCKVNLKPYLSSLVPESIRHCHLCAFGKYPSWDFFLRHMKHRHNITISKLRQEQCQARKSDANSTVSTFEEFPIEFTLDSEGFIIQTRAHYCRLCKCFFELKSENFRQHCLSAEHTAKIFAFNQLAAKDVSFNQPSVPSASSDNRLPSASLISRPILGSQHVSSKVGSRSPEESLDGGVQLVSEDSDVAIYESPVRPVTQSLIKSTENSVCRRETYSTADLLRVSASLIPRKRPGQEQKIIEEVVLENDRTDFSCPADVGNMRNTLNESVIKCCKKDGKLEEEEKVKQQENHDEPESRLQLNDDITFSDTEYEEPIDNECLDLGTDMEKQKRQNSVTPTAHQLDDESQCQEDVNRLVEFNPHEELDFDDTVSIYSGRCVSRTDGIAAEKTFISSICAFDEEENEEEEEDEIEPRKRHDKFRSERPEYLKRPNQLVEQQELDIKRHCYDVAVLNETLDGQMNVSEKTGDEYFKISDSDHKPTTMTKTMPCTSEYTCQSHKNPPAGRAVSLVIHSGNLSGVYQPPYMCGYAGANRVVSYPMSSNGPSIPPPVAQFNPTMPPPPLNIPLQFQQIPHIKTTTSIEQRRSRCPLLPTPNDSF